MKLIGKQIAKSYRVYFQQINQCNYEVKAVDKEEAMSKASRKWKKDNSYVPPIDEVEEVKHED